jgi:hypothetical protein
MKMAQFKPRLGTLHDNRGFYAWYLAQRRRERNGSGGATVRLTQDNQERITEDGQTRET